MINSGQQLLSKYNDDMSIFSGRRLVGGKQVLELFNMLVHTPPQCVYVREDHLASSLYTSCKAIVKSQNHFGNREEVSLINLGFLHYRHTF